MIYSACQSVCLPMIYFIHLSIHFWTFCPIYLFICWWADSWEKTSNGKSLFGDLRRGFAAISPPAFSFVFDSYLKKNNYFLAVRAVEPRYVCPLLQGRLMTETMLH